MEMSSMFNGTGKFSEFDISDLDKSQQDSVDKMQLTPVKTSKLNNTLGKKELSKNHKREVLKPIELAEISNNSNIIEKDAEITEDTESMAVDEDDEEEEDGSVIELDEEDADNDESNSTLQLSKEGNDKMFSHLQQTNGDSKSNKSNLTETEKKANVNSLKTNDVSLKQPENTSQTTENMVLAEIIDDKDVAALDQAAAEVAEVICFEAALKELGRRVWPTDAQKQHYTKGCLWSPDGTCLLVPVHLDGMYVGELK